MKPPQPTERQARLSPEAVAALVRYDPETGALSWRERSTGKPYIRLRWKRHQAGRPCLDTVSKAGYHGGGIGKRYYLAHRVAWALHYGEWPQGQIDHINRDKGDNRISNLRVVDAVGNARNKCRSVANSSGATGVCWHKGAWQSQITVGGRSLYLGRYGTFEEAVAARKHHERMFGFSDTHGAVQ